MNLNIFSAKSRGAEFLKADLSSKGGCTNIFLPESEVFSTDSIKEAIIGNAEMAASSDGAEMRRKKI